MSTGRLAGPGRRSRRSTPSTSKANAWTGQQRPPQASAPEGGPMHSEVERAPRGSLAPVMSRRRFLALAGGTTSLVLLAACQSGAPQAPPAETQSPLAARTLPPISAAQTTPAPTAAPAPAAAPTVGRPEPKGRFAYAWHTSLTPAWLDPQENPPQV